MRYYEVQYLTDAGWQTCWAGKRKREAATRLGGAKANFGKPVGDVRAPAGNVLGKVRCLEWTGREIAP